MPTVLVVDGKLTVNLLAALRRITVIDSSGTVHCDPDGYYVDVEFPAIRRLLAHNPDIVVVGNNLGAGVRVVSELPESLRARTLVVWPKTPPATDEVPYRQLGVSLFGPRHKVAKIVATMIAKGDFGD